MIPFTKLATGGLLALVLTGSFVAGKTVMDQRARTQEAQQAAIAQAATPANGQARLSKLYQDCATLYGKGYLLAGFDTNGPVCRPYYFYYTFYASENTVGSDKGIGFFAAYHGKFTTNIPIDAKPVFLGENPTLVGATYTRGGNSGDLPEENLRRRAINEILTGVDDPAIASFGDGVQPGRNGTTHISEPIAFLPWIQLVAGREHCEFIQNPSFPTQVSSDPKSAYMEDRFIDSTDWDNDATTGSTYNTETGAVINNRKSCLNNTDPKRRKWDCPVDYVVVRCWDASTRPDISY